MKFSILLRCFIYTFYIDGVYSATRTFSCPFDKHWIVDTLGQYQLEYVNDGDEVNIPCCQKDPSPTKLWYKEDRFLTEKEIPLEANTENVKISDTYELTIKEFQENDTGAYHCQDPYYMSSDVVSGNYFNYYYLIDVVRESEPISGNVEAFKKYLTTHISPISEYLSDYASKPELLSLYKSTGMILEVDLRCDEWSDCEPCERVKHRDCHCHIQPRLSDPKLCVKCEKFQYALHMDCRAVWTIKKVLPALSQKVEDVSSFRRIVKCVGICGREAIGGVAYVKKFKLHDISIGASLMLTCPGYALTKKCHWNRDGNKLYSNDYEIDRKISINEFGVLYISDATSKESGNYTCYLDNAMITQNQVRVLETFSEKNASWWRHMTYLQYIILLCFVILVAGLVTAIIQRRNFETIDVKDAVEKFLKKRFEHEKLELPTQSSNE